jgi:hypothetical protein
LEKQQISQLARQINKASTMKVLTLNAFTVGMAVLAATGCASKVWYQPGNTLSQERRDEARCKLEAERNGSPLAMAGLAFAIADKGHKDEIFKQGMLSLGYEQVDKRTVSKEYFEVSSVSRKARGLSPTSRAAIMAFFHQARWRASGLRFLVETPPIPSFQLPGLP